MYLIGNQVPEWEFREVAYGSYWYLTSIRGFAP